MALALTGVAVGMFASSSAGAMETPRLYQQFCAECHQADRLGGSGPALLPESLGRMKAEQAARVILEGRPATQMLPYKDKMTPEEALALAQWLLTPLDKPPVWGEAEIRASHVILHPMESLPPQPVFAADPLNLFVVVEQGDHHFTLLDGDTLEPIGRFPTRMALHGGPKFTPDGRFVFFSSRDGWISKFDLHGLKLVAEIRVGVNTRNVAVSGDGKVVMAANMLPHTLVILDAETLALRQVLPVADPGGASSRVSAVYTAAPRHSFVAALKDLPQVWEIPYNDQAPAWGEATGPREGGALPVRRLAIPEPLDDFFFTADYERLMGASREGGKGRVVHLGEGKAVADIPISGMPHLGSGILWERDGRTVMATPNLKENAITVLDAADWSLIQRIETLGPGFFMRGHEESPYVWTDNMLSPKYKDTVHVIDRQTLKIVKNITPSPGKTAAHVEFTRDGRYVLLSVSEMEGELVIYDAKTLDEVKRLPMKKPSGKYNIHNKITRSSGTSH
ncbi:MAG: c-type cytochrome [Magnetococcales bacterium]|nr:c-type cytochrome [Magnetococcales bacterium]